jgi:hypothetical protein
MAFRPRTPRSNPLDLSTLPPDRLVQLLVVAVLDQVGQDLYDSSGAAVESQLSASHITLAQVSRDSRSFIDGPKAAQRQGGGHKGSLPLPDPGAHPVVRLGGYWIYPPRGCWLRFAHGENDRAMVLSHLQF